MCVCRCSLMTLSAFIFFISILHIKDLVHEIEQECSLPELMQIRLRLMVISKRILIKQHQLCVDQVLIKFYRGFISISNVACSSPVNKTNTTTGTFLKCDGGRLFQTQSSDALWRLLNNSSPEISNHILHAATNNNIYFTKKLSSSSCQSQMSNTE